MRNSFLYKLFLPILLCIITSTHAFAQTPTVNITNFKDTLLCVNGSFQVELTTSAAFDTFTNIFEIYISDSDGNFTNQVLVGQLNNFQSGTTTCTLPSSILAATGYRIRAVAINPSYTSADNGKDIRVSEHPTINATSNSPVCIGQAINVNATTPNQLPSFEWNGPNGFKATQANGNVSASTFSDSGMFYISVTSYKCTSLDSTRVIVTPQPDIQYIDAPTTVCTDEAWSIKAKTNVDDIYGSTKIYPPSPYGPANHSMTVVKANSSWAGSYFVESKIGNCIDTQSIYLTVKPLPDTPTASNNGPLCVGDTLLLTGNSSTPGVTYWWSGPNGHLDSQLNSIINGVIKANEGDYKLYARKNGCNSKPGTTELEVGIPLVPLQISGDTVYCPGQKLRLSCNAPTLVGIEWLGPNGYKDVQRTTSINNISADYSGYYSVTQEVLGCKSPPSSVYVRIPDIKKPKPETNAPLCLGQDLNLKITETPNGTYSWTGPNGYSSTEPNPSINSITKENEGTYTVITTLEHCTETDSAKVIIKPQPEIADISSNTPVCSSTQLMLYAESTIDSCTFEWTGPNGYTSTDQNPSFLFSDNASGTYTVKAIRQGCISSPKNTEVETREGPGATKATNNSPIDEGETLMLFGHNNKDSVTFFWEGPDGFTSNEQNPQINVSTYRNNGQYKLTTIYNQCSVSVYTDVVVHDILGIALSIYPNPNDGKFTIEGITQSDKILNLAIVNHLGKVIFRDEVVPVQSKFKSLVDLTGAPSGVYLLQLSSGIEHRTERVTIIQQ